MNGIDSNALGQRPPSRPGEGVVVGGITATVVAVAAIGAALMWRYGIDAVADAPLHYASGAAADVLLLAGIDPSRLLSMGFRVIADLPAWLYAVVGLLSASIGAGAGFALSRTPDGIRHVGGRRIELNPKRFASALYAAGEVADGLLVHPQVTISRERERRHIFLIAGTGAGKTQILMPVMVRASERGDRSIIYDLKGDLTEKLFDDHTLLIAPWDARGAAWDVAADVRDIAAARALSAALIPENNSENKMFVDGARQILTGLVVTLQNDYPGVWTLAGLARSIEADTAEIAAILRTNLPEAAGLLSGNQDSKTIQSFMVTLRAQLAGLYDLAKAWDRSGVQRWSVRNWLNGNGDHSRVLIQHHSGAPDAAQMVLRMVLRIVLQRVGSPDFVRAKKSTWLFLDEFLQAGKIPELLNIAETARSKNIRLVLAAQSIPGVREVYGDRQADALSETVGTVILGRSRGVTAQWASEQAGQCQIERYQRTMSAPDGLGKTASTSTHWQAQTEPVMRPEQFDAALGVRGRGRRTRVRMLMLAGGDTIGLLDWPLTLLPKIADAHVPRKTEPRSVSGDSTESDEGSEAMRRDSATNVAEADDMMHSEPRREHHSRKMNGDLGSVTRTRRERLRRRRQAVAKHPRNAEQDGG